MKRVIRPDKIAAPSSHSIILQRTSLIKSLTETLLSSAPGQQSIYKLVLISAPAGYGKTTLLADVMQQTSIPCCWCFLEKEDAAPALFLQMLLASVQRFFPALAHPLNALSQEYSVETSGDEWVELAHWERLIDALLKLLEAKIEQRFVFAFCHYQEVNQSADVNHLLNYLLKNLPAQGMIIIESRSIPHLEIALFIARRQIFGLSEQQLRFTAQEIYELAHLQGNTNLTNQDAEDIERVFQGWIAGILLCSFLGRSHLPIRLASRTQDQSVSFSPISFRQLSAYLDNEVFAQEKAIYEFLCETSVLAQLTPVYCNALLESTDAEQKLLYAYQQGLFLVSIETADPQILAFTCHSVVREVFRAKLRTTSFARYLVLEHRATHLFLNRQEYEQALNHALLAEEYSLAIDILLDIAPLLLAQKQVTKVMHWLELLPAERIKQNPYLLLIQAHIYWLNGEYQQIASLLDAAELLLTTMQGQDISPALADLAITRSNLLFSQGAYQHVQELCQRALTLLSADQHYLRIRAYQCLGLCLVAGTGQIEVGIVQLQQALHLSNAQKEKEQTAVLHRQLGTAYSWIGNYILAEYHQKRAQLLWEELDNPRGIINSLTSIGHLKRRQGFMQEAKDVLTTALDMARNIHHFESGEAYALLGLGELSCDTAQYAQALVFLEDSLKLGLKLSDTYLTNCSLCVLATVYMLLADIQTAQFFLNQVVIKEEKKQSFESAFHCLTQGSILLAQQADEQVKIVLENAVDQARKANVQFFLLSAYLRLAVCHLRQGDVLQARLIGEQALKLNKQNNHEHRLQMEIERYPELQKLLGPSLFEVPPQEESSTSIEQPPRVQMLSKDQLPTRLHISALGEPAVFVDDSPITHWRMARAMELYFFLLQSKKPVRKEQIQIALWPDGDPRRIEQTIRSTIYYLRLAIGKDQVVSSSGLYSLDLTSYGQHVWYDVALFEKHHNEAKLALDNANDAQASTAFTEMIKLYKGDYLQPFYGDWCILLRDNLRQAYVQAHQQLAILAWHAEDFEASVQHWQHLLALDTCFEKAHAGMMRYYLRIGQREQALRQYQRCCLHLQEELQTTPGPSLQKLYQRALLIS